MLHTITHFNSWYVFQDFLKTNYLQHTRGCIMYIVYDDKTHSYVTLKLKQNEAFLLQWIQVWTRNALSDTKIKWCLEYKEHYWTLIMTELHFCIDQPQLKGKQYITVSFHIGPWNKAWVSNITMPITGHCQSEMCQFWHLYCTTPQMQLTCCSLLIPSLSPQLYLSCVRRLTFKDQQNGADVTQELVSHSCLFRGSSKEHSISHTCTKYKGLLHVNMWTVEWFKCLNGILLRWFSKNITLLIKNVYESHCRGRPYAFWASAVEGRQKDSKQE